MATLKKVFLLLMLSSVALLIFKTISDSELFSKWNSESSERHNRIFVNEQQPTTEPEVNPFSEPQRKRQARLHEYCERNQAAPGTLSYTQFLYNDQQKLVYCEVPKVGCTTWRRVLALFEGHQKTLSELDSRQIHHVKLKSMKELKKDSVEKIHRYYSFMFSRHPHDRLFSAYRNKFMETQGITWYLEWLGPWMVYPHLQYQHEVDEYVHIHNINRKTLKVSFEQFVRFILKKPRDFDTHWQPQTDICKMCNVKFNHIGKFETMNEDAKEIFEEINQQRVYEMYRNTKMLGYKKKTSTMLKKYYGELPKELLPKIYEYYEDDFKAFGYDPHHYIDY